MRTGELILYANMEHGDILTDMTAVERECEKLSDRREDGGENHHSDGGGLRKLAARRDAVKVRLYSCLGRLFKLASSCGFSGNLWHAYLTYLIVNHENPYSASCEMTGRASGGINDVAAHDFQIFHELFSVDFAVTEKYLEVKFTHLITDYEAPNEHAALFDPDIVSAISDLSRRLSTCPDAVSFKDEVTKFYGRFGAGKYGLHKAFRLSGARSDLPRESSLSAGIPVISPVTCAAFVTLDDIVGYESAKQKLIENTECFINGRPANNCLLYGDAGTGKSTCVKAILNRYYEKGLRMIGIYKHEFKYLGDVISEIKNRNYRFIIFMDDLSFEEFETEYKYLKAVIEGGLEKKPDNVLIYATSNRRHLIRETFRDKEEYDEDVHANDTVQEKLSLAARFGVQIYFGRPGKKEFQRIVTELAKREDISIPEDEILSLANKWEISHGGMTGRTARQFVDYLAGKLMSARQ